MKLCELTQNELCLLPEADLSLSQLREHVDQCPLCQAFAAKIRQQDRQLSTLFYPKSPNWANLVRIAMVPTVSPVVAKKERALSKIAVAFALAASLLIGVVGLLTQLNKTQTPNAFALNEAASKSQPTHLNEVPLARQPTPETQADQSVNGLPITPAFVADSKTNYLGRTLPSLGEAKPATGTPMAPEGFSPTSNQPRSGGAPGRMGFAAKDRLQETEGNNLRSLLRKDPLVGQRIKFMVELCNQQRALVVGLAKPEAKADLAPGGGFGGSAKPMEVSPEALVQSYEELIGSDLPALLKSLPKGTQIKEMKALLDHLERTESEFSRLAADHPEKAVWLKQLVRLSRTGILQIRTAIP